MYSKEQFNEEIIKLKSQNKSLSAENSYYKHIINELEKELEQEIATVGVNRTVDNNNPEWWYKLNCYGNILDKLKELKENNKIEKINKDTK